MTRRELVLNKLYELPEDEVSEAVRKLVHHVEARMRLGSFFDRTRTGAHGEKNLGINAIDYYVGETIKRLYSPNGWDWKFEKFTLAIQLMRIANKLISDKVEEFKRKKADLPTIDGRDIGDIHDVDAIAEVHMYQNEEIYSKVIEIAHEESKGDDDLEFFTLRYFEGADFASIAREMALSVEQVYVLRKKLVRRLTKHKAELTA